jgi:hypothetical protein
MPAAHPTPDRTEMAFSGQFFSQAPHSMQRSLSKITALLFSIAKTAWGQTMMHIRQPLHFS